MYDKSTTHVVCRHRIGIFNNSYAYLFWLANNKKANIQSFVWATVTKLGMWVVVDTSTTHMVCRHQMRMFNTSFAYLFWLANNKKQANIQSSVWAIVTKLGMWVVVGIRITYVYLSAEVLPMWFVITKCAYLIPHLHICSDWLITTKAINIQSSESKVYGLQWRNLVCGYWWAEVLPSWSVVT